MPLGGHVGPCLDSMCTNSGLQAIKAPRVGGRSSPPRSRTSLQARTQLRVSSALIGDHWIVRYSIAHSLTSPTTRCRVDLCAGYSTLPANRLRAPNSLYN